MAGAPLATMGETGGGAGGSELGVLLIRGWDGPVSSPAPLRAAIRSLIDNGRAGTGSVVGEEGLPRAKGDVSLGTQESEGGRDDGRAYSELGPAPLTAPLACSRASRTCSTSLILVLN